MAALQGRGALGPRAGQPLRRLRSAASAQPTARRCARLEGFSLHADMAVPALRRDRLERLCRYLLRPPLALERMTETTGGPLLYQFRRRWRHGSTALRLESVEPLERLAALVHAPRRPLLSYHGALAPPVAWRAAIEPQPAALVAPGAADRERPRSPGRRSWATLLRRVFAVEGLVCPRCAGPRRIVSSPRSPGSPAMPARGAAPGLQIFV